MKLLQNITLFLFLMVITSVTSAQEIPIPDYTIVNNGRIGTLITQGVIDRQQQNSSKPKTQVPAAGSKTTLAYLPTPALKQETVSAYTDHLKTTNPAAAKMITDNFGSGKYDYGTIYNGLVKGNGLKENDAVDVITSYIVLGYMIVNNVQNGNAVTPAMVQGVRAQFGPILAGSNAFSAAGVPARLGEEMKLQFVVIHGGWQSAIKENTLPAYRQGISTIFKNQWNLDFSKFKLTTNGLVAAVQPTGATRPQPISNSGSQQVAGGTAPGVEGWFFRAVGGYPAAVSFEPVILFKNGDYYEVGELPLELLNVSEAKQNKPAAWGTWEKKGATYWLTGADHKAYDYTLGKGNWFPAYPYAANIPLKKGYERVSGGDYGAGTSMLSISTIYFLDATHFRQGANTGISSPSASGGSKSSAAGTYKVYGNTLELIYSHGKVVKKSFAFGASGAPAKPTNTLLFIGGDAYTDTE